MDAWIRLIATLDGSRTPASPLRWPSERCCHVTMGNRKGTSTLDSIPLCPAGVFAPAAEIVEAIALLKRTNLRSGECASRSLAGGAGAAAPTQEGRLGSQTAEAVDVGGLPQSTRAASGRLAGIKNGAETGTTSHWQSQYSLASSFVQRHHHERTQRNGCDSTDQEELPHGQ